MARNIHCCQLAPGYKENGLLNLHPAPPSELLPKNLCQSQIPHEAFSFNDKFTSGGHFVLFGRFTFFVTGQITLNWVPTYKKLNLLHALADSFPL